MSQAGSNGKGGGGGGTITSVQTSNATPQFALSGTTETVNFGISNLLLGNNGATITSGTLNTGYGLLSSAALTSGIANTFYGNSSGNSMSTGEANTGIGFAAQFLGVSGNFNTSVGYESLYGVVSGTNNIALGYLAGSVYEGASSSNISIGNSGVNTTESNTIRIGTQGTGAGQQNRNFQAGITGNTITNSPMMVTIDNSGGATNGQLGIASIPSGFTPVNFSAKLSENIENVTGDNTQYTILYDTVVFNNGGGTYSSGTGNYTIPATGIYQINLTHYVFGGSVAQTDFLGFLLINGSTNIRLMDANPGALGLSSTSNEFIASGSYLYSATVGDTISGNVEVGDATKNVGVAGGTESCLFSLFRVA